MVLFLALRICRVAIQPSFSREILCPVADKTVVKVRFIEQEPKRRRCHYSTAITMYNQDLLHNDLLLQTACLLPVQVKIEIQKYK